MDVIEAISTILSVDAEKGTEIAQQLSLIDSENTAISCGSTVLRRLSKSEMKASGLTEKRAEKLLAALALGRSAYVQPFKPQCEVTVVTEASVAARMLMPKLAYQEKENAAVVIMDVKHKWLATKIVSVGTSTACLFYPDEVFREAIRYGGKNIIIAHNHPSGILSASPDDLSVTKRMIMAGDALDIKVIDHLIIGNGDFESLRESTCLWHKSD